MVVKMRNNTKTIQIVLDTNIIVFGNWLLDGPTMSVVGNLIAADSCRLVVPKVVVLEAHNKYREEMARHIQQLQKFNNFVIDPNTKVDIPNIERACKDYRKRLAARLKALKAEVPTFSRVSQSAVLSRVLARKRPFQESGKGYRDTLIWEAVLKVARGGGTTFFVSANHKDFCSKDDSKLLHPDLVQDLKARGLEEDCICVCPDTKALVNDHLGSLLKEVDATQDAVEHLKRGEYKSFSIREWFNENQEGIGAQLNRTGALSRVLDQYHELEDPHVSYIEDPDDISVSRVFAVEANAVVVEAKASGSVIIDVFIYKSDYYAIEDMYPLSVINHDWNDHYIYGQLTLEMVIEFSVMFNPASLEVEDYEVNGIDQSVETFGWCRSCGAPVDNDASETCSKCGKPLF